MKKLTLLMCAFAFLFKVSAQEPQFVSKEQQNRNEEYNKWNEKH